VSVGIPWGMPLGFGNKEKENWWEKKKTQGKLDQQLPTLAFG
jgi:hypothetical protein